MHAWYAVDTKFGDREIHDIISWDDLKILLKQIMVDGDLHYIEIDETDKPKYKKEIK